MSRAGLWVSHQLSKSFGCFCGCSEVVHLTLAMLPTLFTACYSRNIVPYGRSTSLEGKTCRQSCSASACDICQPCTKIDHIHAMHVDIYFALDALTYHLCVIVQNNNQLTDKLAKVQEELQLCKETREAAWKETSSLRAEVYFTQCTICIHCCNFGQSAHKVGGGGGGQGVGETWQGDFRTRGCGFDMQFSHIALLCSGMCSCQAPESQQE